MSKLEAAAAACRIGGHIAWEKLSRPRPKDLSAIQPSIDAITESWLSAALCRAHPGAKVERFERSRATRGSTSREALRVHYNDAGRQAGLPEHLFAKCTPHFTSRLIVGLSGALANESGFYDRVRPRLDIDWNSPRLEREFTWLKTTLEFQENTNRLIDFERRSLIGIARAEAVIPASLLARRSELWSTAMHSPDLNSREPRTYLHHDVHIGNWYRTGEGRMGLTDWQCNVKGQWGSDFAYALMSAL